MGGPNTHLNRAPYAVSERRVDSSMFEVIDQDSYDLLSSFSAKSIATSHRQNRNPATSSSASTAGANRGHRKELSLDDIPNIAVDQDTYDILSSVSMTGTGSHKPVTTSSMTGAKKKGHRKQLSLDTIPNIHTLLNQDTYDILRSTSSTPPGYRKQSSFDLSSFSAKDNIKKVDVPANDSSDPPRKRLSFATSPDIRSIEHHNEYTQAERASYWYQPNEIQEIRQEVCQLTKKCRRRYILSVSFSDPDEEHCLGLWMKSAKAARAKKSRWVMALSSVMDEQKKQGQRCIKDPERIAQRYRSFTAASEKIAHDKANRNCEATTRTKPSRLFGKLKSAMTISNSKVTSVPVEPL